uniref:Glutamate-1-semialdehyde 2,1-aminomutase n=1 Tax=Pyricularia oryzae (strain P131) TaxID=1143193 RepID=L7JIW0_PYRO1
MAKPPRMVICREQQCRRAGIFAVMAMQPEHENTAMWDMKTSEANTGTKIPDGNLGTNKTQPSCTNRRSKTMATTAEGDFLWGATMQARARKLLLEYQERYVAANPKSADSFGRASVSLAGGNTRSVLHYDPFPMVLVSGRDCFVSSEDGREYVDFVSEYSACMLGHSHPAVAEAVQAVMSRGINLGGASKEEQVLAALLTERIPSMARVRFCNSGTEANTMALTLARHHTGRRKILAFENGYHGGFIGFDSGVLPTTVPFEFVLARYDDATHVRELVDDSFAAIIVEPMQGVAMDPPALGGSTSSAQQQRLSHSGTFNNNAFSMTAGAVACRLITREAIARANALGDRLREGITAAGRNAEASPWMWASGFGSMLNVHFGGFAAAELRDLFFFFMLDRGFYVSRRGLIALNLMHTDHHNSRSSSRHSSLVYKIEVLYLMQFFAITMFRNQKLILVSYS